MQTGLRGTQCTICLATSMEKMNTFYIRNHFKAICNECLKLVKTMELKPQ